MLNDRRLDRPIALAVDTILPLQTRNMDILTKWRGKLHNSMGEPMN
jgi:hypothetical protein